MPVLSSAFVVPTTTYTSLSLTSYCSVPHRRRNTHSRGGTRIDDSPLGVVSLHAINKKKKKDNDGMYFADETNSTNTIDATTAATATGATLAAARTVATAGGITAATTTTTTTTAGSSVVGAASAARSAATIAGVTAATTTATTGGTTATGTSVVGAASAARSAATIAGVTAATTTTTGTTGSSVVGAASAARSAATIAGVTAASTTVGTTTSTVATTSTLTAARTAAGTTASTWATTRAATVGTTAVGATAAASSSATSTTAASARSLPYFASAVAPKAGLVASGRAMTAGGVVGMAAADSLLDGAAATSTAAATTTTSIGEALLGAGSELVGDASTFMGDAVIDGVSSVGSAVADAAVGVATDAAIGSGTVWGVWDGLHRVLPAWVFSGGAVVVGGEVAFAIFAFYIASKTSDSGEEGDVATRANDTSSTHLDVREKKIATGEEASPSFPTTNAAQKMDETDLLIDVEEALREAESAMAAPASESRDYHTIDDPGGKEEGLASQYQELQKTESNQSSNGTKRGMRAILSRNKSERLDDKT